MSYAQEKQMELHRDAIQPGDRVVIVDDFVASGGTASAALNVVERAGGTCVGMSCAFALDYPPFQVAMAQRGVPVRSVINVQMQRPRC